MTVLGTIGTMAMTATARSVFDDLKRRVRAATPQGKLEAESTEMVVDMVLENAEVVKAQAVKIEATDQALAHLTGRTEEIAAIVLEVVDYIDRRIAQVHKSPDFAPPLEDRENVVKAALKQFHDAGSNEKRNIIWEALNNSFNPQFYKDGLYRILWRMVEKLEYPDFRVLRQLIDGTYQMGIIPANAMDVFFAKRLVAERLLDEKTLSDGRLQFQGAPVALQLLEFISPQAASS